MHTSINAYQYRYTLVYIYNIPGIYYGENDTCASILVYYCIHIVLRSHARAWLLPTEKTARVACSFPTYQVQHLGEDEAGGAWSLLAFICQ